MKLNIVVIYGSVRPQRQGIKAAKFVMNELKKRGHDAFLIDPMEYKLPLLEKRYKEYAPGEAPMIVEHLHEAFTVADAFVIVSAEYNHSMPPALKNILDHFGVEFGRKICGIVTYSAGPFGGVRVVAQVRELMAELGCLAIPNAMPVPAVQDQFDDSGVPKDAASWDKRIASFLEQFEWYAEALKTKRENISK